MNQVELVDQGIAHTGAKPADAILEIDRLQTHFFTPNGVVRAVDGVSYSVRSREILGVVGESGCGKSVTALSILRLVADPPGLDELVGRWAELRLQLSPRQWVLEHMTDAICARKYLSLADVCVGGR